MTSSINFKRNTNYWCNQKVPIIPSCYNSVNPYVNKKQTKKLPFIFIITYYCKSGETMNLNAIKY